VAGQLPRRLGEAPEDERSRILAGDERDSMAYEQVQEHDTSQEEGGYDEQGWQSYRAEDGPQWAGGREPTGDRECRARSTGPGGGSSG
jgi:hypothetical protein